MVCVEFLSRRKRVLRLTVTDDHGLRTEGDSSWVDWGARPYSSVMGRHITWHDNPQEWLRAYAEECDARGTMTARVTDDDRPSFERQPRQRPNLLTVFLLLVVAVTGALMWMGLRADTKKSLSPTLSAEASRFNVAMDRDVREIMQRLPRDATERRALRAFVSARKAVCRSGEQRPDMQTEMLEEACNAAWAATVHSLRWYMTCPDRRSLAARRACAVREFSAAARAYENVSRIEADIQGTLGGGACNSSWRAGSALDRQRASHFRWAADKLSTARTQREFTVAVYLPTLHLSLSSVYSPFDDLQIKNCDPAKRYSGTLTDRQLADITDASCALLGGTAPMLGDGTAVGNTRALREAQDTLYEILVSLPAPLGSSRLYARWVRSVRLRRDAIRRMEHSYEVGDVRGAERAAARAADTKRWSNDVGAQLGLRDCVTPSQKVQPRTLGQHFA
jgi:hypothetical protein